VRVAIAGQLRVIVQQVGPQRDIFGRWEIAQDVKANEKTALIFENFPDLVFD